jgi:hypothetical protein
VVKQEREKHAQPDFENKIQMTSILFRMRLDPHTATSAHTNKRTHATKHHRPNLGSAHFLLFCLLARAFLICSSLLGHEDYHFNVDHLSLICRLFIKHKSKRTKLTAS